MYEKISIEEAKELISKGWYKDSLSKLEFDSSTPPWVQENEKINFVRIVYSNAYLRKYPDRVYPEETVSSSVVSAPKVSSDAISNDTDKDPAITDIAGGTGVAIELLKEDTNLSESTDLISSNNVSVAELPKNSDEILLTVSSNSDSVNDTEQSDNKDQYISDTDEELLATDEEENLDEEASVTSSDNKIDIAEEPSVDNILEALPSVAPSSTNDEYVVKCPAVDTKSPFASFVGVFTSAWRSFTKMFNSKTESTEAAVLDTSDSLPEKSSVFGDNLNDDVDTIGGISEVNLFDQD